MTRKVPASSTCVGYATNFWIWASRADQLRACHDLRANTARVCLDASNRYQIREEVVKVRFYSTTHTVLGTFFAIATLLFFGTTFFVRFASQEPTVNVATTEVFDKAFALPDFAISFSEELTEVEMLNYLHLRFRHFTIYNGFSTGGKSRVTEVRDIEALYFGEDCQMKFGYKAGSFWPVFCVLNSSDLLQGWYGDPVYQYVSLDVERCNISIPENKLPPRLASHWNGTCFSDEAMLQAFGSRLFFNVWFRFQREDWAQSGSLLGPRGTGEGDWTWYLFDTSSYNSGLEFVVNLRHNDALVHSRWGDIKSEPTKFEWFDYGYQVQNSQSSNMLKLIDLEFRIDRQGRHVSVQYSTIFEVLAQISGSWGICLVLGIALAKFLQRCTRLPDFNNSLLHVSDIIRSDDQAEEDVKRSTSLPALRVMTADDVDLRVKEQVIGRKSDADRPSQDGFHHIPAEGEGPATQPKPGTRMELLDPEAGVLGA
eukprot:gnl/TRDRNA2_/TRDRNA2_176191_c0_seq2.p1 gnl/TRDRNA2_/TRDRNA2_176191_c0~~gnl/TRDRNA2_/TRDRNA2_176191_c0_seq2.p1  ORF type:complete len:483 (-),score=44.26 gnl/TRDRNA2_/TRDRNA2_176191_c0_seq2:262-1710(-)